MARVTEIVAISLAVAYVVGSPAAVAWRPITVEAPFVAWHKSVNVAAETVEGAARRSGHALGNTIRDTILSGTFLGRAGA